MIRYAELNRHTRQLIADLIRANESGVAIPTLLPTRGVRPSQFPEIPSDSNHRSTQFPNDVPLDLQDPVVIAGDQLLDATYRRLYSPDQEAGKSVLAVDLSGLVSNRVIQANTFGTIAGSPRSWIQRMLSRGDVPRHFVWDIKQKAFARKGSGHTLYMDEAALFSDNNLRARYQSSKEYRTYSPELLNAFNGGGLEVTRENFVFDGKHYIGWAWSLAHGHGRNERVEIRACRDPEDGKRQAVSFALKSLGDDGFDPLMMVATKSQFISDGARKPCGYDDLEAIRPDF
ncbi:hypothetical protein [Pseudomonas amygdali]|uniref:Uncharacterized protein n=1 Tax=Pseudomonas amygdali pv. lachrymans str. M301315 TaxID=629260 RepID=A0AAD0VAA6_PSEAV|nr:hypothetical protein [Pseudomonas amygdali]AXH60233.1 hypothetical protein PLA107_034165 [Pseudomonas amygdali pv. lachrymans str. M301315]RMT05877.1 hypothetical protein ALP54_04065 [Pseudomonas amygdali pv. lachrymans]